MRQLRVAQQSLTKDTLKALQQALIRWRLEYCNAMLAGSANKRLQSVHGCLRQGTRCRNHITRGCSKVLDEAQRPRQWVAPWAPTCPMTCRRYRPVCQGILYNLKAQKHKVGFSWDPRTRNYTWWYYGAENVQDLKGVSRQTWTPLARCLAPIRTWHLIL